MPACSRKNVTRASLRLRVLPPPLGQARVDGQGGLLGQPQHLGVGLARELIGDEGLGGGRVGVGQLLEGLGDRPGLGGGEGPVAQPGADGGQPGAELPGERRGALGGLGEQASAPDSS